MKVCVCALEINKRFHGGQKKRQIERLKHGKYTQSRQNRRKVKTRKRRSSKSQLIEGKKKETIHQQSEPNSNFVVNPKRIQIYFTYEENGKRSPINDHHQNRQSFVLATNPSEDILLNFHIQINNNNKKIKVQSKQNNK